MKPLRPAWVTILIVLCLLFLTGWTYWVGGLFALAPLALAAAFMYDLTHHARSAHVRVISRIIILLTLTLVILTGVYVVRAHSL